MITSRKFGYKLFALLSVVVLLVAGLLVGCSKSDASLREGAPQWASEITLSEWTVAVVNDFNEGNFQAITDALVDSDLTADDLKNQSEEALNKLGTFEAFGDAKYYTGESLGRPYSCVIQQTDYENGTAEFRISFFEDGKLAGFYFFPQINGEDGSEADNNA